MCGLFFFSPLRYRVSYGPIFETVEEKNPTESSPFPSFSNWTYRFFKMLRTPGRRVNDWFGCKKSFSSLFLPFPRDAELDGAVSLKMASVDQDPPMDISFLSFFLT